MLYLVSGGPTDTVRAQEYGARDEREEGEKPGVQTQERDLSGNSEQIKSQGEPRFDINRGFMRCCNDH